MENKVKINANAFGFYLMTTQVYPVEIITDIIFCNEWMHATVCHNFFYASLIVGLIHAHARLWYHIHILMTNLETTICLVCAAAYMCRQALLKLGISFAKSSFMENVFCTA